MADTPTVKFVFPGADAKRTIVWPCKIAVPQDGGTTEDQSVDVRFNILAREVYTKVVDEAIANKQMSNLALYDAVVDGFVGFADVNKAVVGDKEAKAFFRGLDYAVAGILRGFSEMRMGLPAKN